MTKRAKERYHILVMVVKIIPSLHVVGIMSFKFTWMSVRSISQLKRKCFVVRTNATEKISLAVIMLIN